MSTVLSLVSGPVRYALIASVIPFFAHFTIVSNGVYRDYVAIAAGGLAIVLGLIAFTEPGHSEDKGARSGLTFLVLALAVFQVAKGFGLLAFSLG